ncbi:hypothetical protein ASE04_03870 [Rhizobium sp. Root708]|uniref:hypothetical protein n=1 Tax=Rhizobium sp. Root708 TaxID=1736592 RepID=UPI0006F5CD0C|nr:hypothetical protein [Rhizobium sp. Root708]KRB58845.1 hypothetical protein ASE04_03870 [Rhizobium sp. Root708]
MSGLETAIRTALSNADRDNPEVRAKIYQSARQALEAGLRKQDVTDADAVAHHRHRLETTIHMIEAEERERLHPRQGPPEVAVPPVVDVPRATTHRPAEGAADSLSIGGQTRAHTVADPRFDDDSSLAGIHAEDADHLGTAPAPVAAETMTAEKPATNMDFRPERAAARRKPRKFFSRLLVWCVLLAFIGIGAWWAHTSGLLMTSAERDTSVANPPPSTEPEDFNGNENAENGGATGEAPTIDPQNSFSSAWIEVFKPSDADKIVPGAQAKTQNVAENDGPAVRLISQSGDTAGNVGISVPADVLQQLAGKSSTVAITLQSTTDEPTQVTVECDFQSLGDCARHRFTVTREKSDVLLQVRFDRSLAPSSAGKLMINSDLDGKARGINLYAVRILPGQ